MAAGALAAHPTFFECVTAIAFDVFARSGVEFAVYEVGMGGRLDATNIVTPEVAVITQIDFDHEELSRPFTRRNCRAKKPESSSRMVLVVSAAERPEARAVIAQRCRNQHARLVEIDAAWRDR